MNYRTNLLPEIKKIILGELTPLYGRNESQAMLDILIEEYFGLSRVEQALNRDYRLSESELLQLHFAVKKLKAFMPLQYVLGKARFMDMELKVNGSVLIPRPETEEMVRYIIAENRQKAPSSILDIGTGSGAIAIALKKAFPQAGVTAVDVSDAALEVAAANAAANDCEIGFQKTDILNVREVATLPRFGLIVSNPPYVTHSEKSRMSKNVLDYEPHVALFTANDDPLLFYRAISVFSRNHLLPGGKLYLEINESFAVEVCEILEKPEFNAVKSHKDIHGKERFVSGIISLPL